MNVSATEYYSKRVTLQCLGRTQQDRFNSLMDIPEVRRRVQTYFDLTCPFKLVYSDLGSAIELETNLDLCGFLKYPRITGAIEVQLIQDGPTRQKPNGSDRQMQPKVTLQRSLHKSKWADASIREEHHSSGWSMRQNQSEVANESNQALKSTPPLDNEAKQPSAAKLSVELWRRSAPASSQGKKLFTEKLKVAAMVKQLLSKHNEEGKQDDLACDLLVDQAINETNIDPNVLRTTLIRIKERKANEGQLIDFDSH